MTTAYKPAILASFLLTSALGASFIFFYWQAKVLTEIGVRNGILFVGLMACIHAIGLLLYERQLQAIAAPATNSPIQPSQLKISSSIGQSIKAAIWQQVILLVLTVLILDGGQIFQMTVIAAIAHWITIAAISVRRRSKPTQVDLAVIKFGFIPMILIVGRMAPWIHQALNR